MQNFVCHGLQVGETIVPAFSVGPGEIAKLVFPSGNDREMHRVLNAILANRDGRIETNGRMATVELPMTRSPLREMFHRQTAAEWLVARCGLSREEAQAGLEPLGVKPDVPISFLAGNPRWLIGFAAAMSSRPAAVVFTTAFCDPMGMQQALATASARLEDAAGVYLTCDTDLEIDEPEYATILNVAVSDRTMVA